MILWTTVNHTGEKYPLSHGTEAKNKNRALRSTWRKYTTLSDWVNGKTYPRIDKIERMAAYFGVEKSALLEDRNHLPQDAIPYTPRPTKPIPIVGVVNCGMPLLAEDNIEGYIETPLEDLNSGEEYFWLRAKGDSMTNIGIHEGDFLLIRKQSNVDSGVSPSFPSMGTMPPSSA